MRATKRFFALLLALTLMLSLAVPAFASEAAVPTTGTITVTNTTGGHDYKLYKLLKMSYDPGETDSPEDDKYAWYATDGSPWLTFLSGAEGANYVTITSITDPVTQEVTHVVAGKDGFNINSASDFALAALKWVKAYEADATTGHGTAAHACLVKDTHTAAADGDPVVFEGLDYGYYLVDSSVGAYGMLYPMNKDLTFVDKNQKPVPEKEVLEVNENKLSDPGTWGTTNDTEYGGVVDFHIDFQKKPGAQNYAVHDDLDPNLTLIKDSIRVYTITKNDDGTVTGTGELKQGTMDADGNVDAESNYAVRYAGDSVVCDLTLHDPNSTFVCDFEIRFKNTAIKGMEDNQWVRVSYQATLNTDAPVDVALPNKTVMTYGDKGVTVYDQTETYTHSLRIFKYEKLTGDEKGALGGAIFRLLNYETQQPYGLVSLGNQPFTLNDSTVAQLPVYRLATDAEIAAAQSREGSTQPDDETAPTIVYSFTTPDDHGRVVIHGLDSGLFYLQETQAPQGYNLMDDMVVVYISGKGAAAQVRYMMKKDFDTKIAAEGAAVDTLVGWATDTGKRVSIENKAGAQLPETGGMGTTVLYILGATMMLGAAVILVTKRRMNAK